MRISMCMYGEDYRKNTSLFTVNAHFLGPLHRPCSAVAGCLPQDWHTHVPLEGSATTAAACYPADLCKLWASLLAAHLRALGPGLPGDFDTFIHSSRRHAVEKLYITDLMRSLPWRCIHASRISHKEHINVSELRIRCDLICRQAAQHPNARHMFLVDSLVALGAAAKGRSASPALNSLLRRIIPFIIGRNF